MREKKEAGDKPFTSGDVSSMEVEQVLPNDEFRVRGALKRRCLLHPDGAGQERNMDTRMEGGTYDDVLEENSDLYFGLLTKASTVEPDKTGSYHQNQFSSADRRTEILCWRTRALTCQLRSLHLQQCIKKEVMGLQEENKPGPESVPSDAPKTGKYSAFRDTVVHKQSIQERSLESRTSMTISNQQVAWATDDVWT